MNTSDEVSALAERIKALRGPLETLAKHFRTEDAARSFDRYSSDHWRRNTYGNALIRLRLFTEQNFSYIEPLGLLAVARYILELSVWLRLIDKDRRYALVYYSEWLTAQKKYYSATLTHFTREVTFLRKLSTDEADAVSNQIADAKEGGSSGKHASSLGRATADVDAEASRRFIVMAEDAKVRGHGFQADLVEREVLPGARRNIEDLEAEIANFKVRVPENVKVLMSRKWQWSAMAEEAGLKDEYDYIYTYASKLLHATPFSLYTDKKNLELLEIYIFLRYIHVTILDICAMAEAQPECAPKNLPSDESTLTAESNGG